MNMSNIYIQSVHKIRLVHKITSINVQDDKQKKEPRDQKNKFNYT